MSGFYSIDGKVSERTPLLGDGSGVAGGRSNNNSSYVNGAGQEPTPTDRLLSEGAQQEEVPLRKLAPLLAALFTSLLLSAFDATLVVTLVAPITTAFGASNKAPWVGMSYLLTTTAFCAAYGKAADILGRREVLLIAISFFGLGTLLCACAPSIGFLLFARTVQGFGGAGIQTTVSVVLSDVLSLRQRGIVQGLGNLVFSLCTSSGGPVGGLIYSSLGWRAAFAVQLPILVVAFVAVNFLVDVPLPLEASQLPLRAKLARFDVSGVATLVSTVLCSQLAVTFFCAQGKPITHPSVWGLALGSVFSLGLFLFCEGYVAKEPILPLRLLTRPATMCVATYFFLSNFSILAFNFHFPLILETVLLYTPAQAGMRMATASLGIAIGSLSTGLYIKRFGRYKNLLLAMTSLVVLVMAYLATVVDRRTTPTWFWWVVGLPYGLGVASCGTIMLVALLSTVEKSDLAIVNGMMYLFRSSGAIFGVGIGGAVSQYVTNIQLHRRITPETFPEQKDIPGTIQWIRLNSAKLEMLQPEKLRIAALDSYEIGIRAVFRVVLVGMALGFILCLPVAEAKLNEGQKAGDGKPVVRDEEEEPLLSAAPAEASGSGRGA